MEKQLKTIGCRYLCPCFENSQFFHGCSTLSVQLAGRSFSGLNFVQWRNKQIVYSTEIIEITDNSTSNPCTTHLAKGGDKKKKKKNSYFYIKKLRLNIYKAGINMIFFLEGTNTEQSQWTKQNPSMLCFFFF